jgi:hypothetical protein
MTNESRMVEILDELLTWTKVTSFKQVKQTLLEALPKPQDRLVYFLSDGTKTGTQISQESGVNNAIISGLHNGWAKLGLVTKDKTGYRKRFNLEDFGIEVPDLAELKAIKKKG